MLALLAYWRNPRADTSPFHSGFTESQIAECEQTIRDYYLNQLRNSSSAAERQEVEDGSATVEVHMIKVADRKLEGFAKISINTQEARDVGLNEITQTCEATMDMDSQQFIWKCRLEH
jgi:hypothetical protein